MKLSIGLLFPVYGKQPTNRQIIAAHVAGEKLDWGSDERARSLTHWDNCPILAVPSGANQILCNGSKCTPKCQPGFGTTSPAKVTCKMQRSGARWTGGVNGELPACQTCEPFDPKIIDDKIVSFCVVEQWSSLKVCSLNCRNDWKVNSSSGPRNTLDVKCRCKSGGCHWYHQRDQLDNVETWPKCVPPTTTPQPTPSPTSQCSNKPQACTNVSLGVKFLNTWSCRNCFRIRAYYGFKSFGITNWDSRDFLDFKFSAPVQFVRWAHPMESWEDLGNNEYRVFFSADKVFHDEMDFSAELQYLGDDPIVDTVQSCPCSNLAIAPSTTSGTTSEMTSGTTSGISTSGSTTTTSTRMTLTTTTTSTTTSTTFNQTIEPTSAPTCSKTNVCQDITWAVWMMNSWTCRNCFRIRNKFNLPIWFTNNDFVDITFDNEVFWLQKPVHPAKSATHLGGNVWRVFFSDKAEFTDRRIDWTGELRWFEEPAQIVSAQTCQCN